MKCPKCGKNNDPDDDFCEKCGYRLKEVKKITVGLILSWVFGVLFLLAGIGAFAETPIIGFLIIICSAMIIPYFNKLTAKHLHFEVSSGIKIILVIIILILAGYASSTSFKQNTTIQPTERVQEETSSRPTQSEIIEPETPEPKTVTPVKKVKSASLTIDRVQIQVGNLYPTRVSITNTGDVIISPKFDLYVYDTSGSEVCSGSPMVTEFTSISSGEKKTGELLVMGCMFKKDGTYTLKVDLLDEDYNKLDTETKEFVVDYWKQFQMPNI